MKIEVIINPCMVNNERQTIKEGYLKYNRNLAIKKCDTKFIKFIYDHEANVKTDYDMDLIFNLNNESRYNLLGLYDDDNKLIACGRYTYNPDINGDNTCHSQIMIHEIIPLVKGSVENIYNDFLFFTETHNGVNEVSIEIPKNDAVLNEITQNRAYVLEENYLNDYSPVVVATKTVIPYIKRRR